jgi:hypothetical protein
MKQTEGGYYYDLFHFFSERHGLTLVDTEIEEIIAAVDKFRDDKHYEAHIEAAAALDDDGSGIDYDNLHDDTCYACGGDNGEHMKGCPEDHSPYAELLRNGYD